MAGSHQPGYLVVGHGTRDLAGQAEFREVVQLLADRLPQPVAAAFLELAQPTIADGLAELHRRGVRQVFVVPLLLFTAGHAKEDVPGEVAQAAAALGMEIVGQAGALELHPKLLELSQLRFLEAVGAGSDISNTRLLMVGRGGSDPTALDMMRRYAQALSASLGMKGETAFIALARPTLPEALQDLAASGAEQVVVQPHLLFQGDVLHAINRHVTQIQEACPSTTWRLAEHLGAHPLLVEAVLANMAQP